MTASAPPASKAKSKARRYGLRASPPSAEQCKPEEHEYDLVNPAPALTVSAPRIYTNTASFLLVQLSRLVVIRVIPALLTVCGACFPRFLLLSTSLLTVLLGS
jgi:hypothetical protein